MKIDSILLIEPEQASNYYPFSVLHMSWEIRVGALTLFEKLAKLLPNANLKFSSRRHEHIKSFYKRYNIEDEEIDEENLLVFRSSILPNEKLIDQIKSKYKQLAGADEMPVRFTCNGEPFAIFLPAREINISSELTRKDLLTDLNIKLLSRYKSIEINDCQEINYLFDAIYANGDAIQDDAKFFKTSMLFDFFEGVHQYGDKPVIIGKGTKIMPGCVIDTSKGPVIIGENVKIMSQSTIVGPCFIGDNSLIKIGAKIYEDCSFGEYCKVGGELENTIIHSYSNKQHDGFLGHSYIGQWVNFGADTNNSDLKNTYGNITINLDGLDVDSGHMFLGLLCGDHTKTGINSMFTTGAVCGICGILVREWFLPNFIPSFSWGGSKNSPIYKASKAIDVARRVMQRRGKELLAEEIKLMEMEYEKVK